MWIIVILPVIDHIIDTLLNIVTNVAERSWTLGTTNVCRRGDDGLAKAGTQALRECLVRNADAQRIVLAQQVTSNIKGSLIDYGERFHRNVEQFSRHFGHVHHIVVKVVDLIVVVLIVSAAALAFIVLYNLTNINVSERVREIASLKVLGFTRGEVYAYIFREIMLLSVAGDALGMVLGTYLATFVITTAEVDYVMFGRSIHWPSYCYAFALTLVFTVLVILFMRRKLDHVNMAESLKSVD